MSRVRIYVDNKEISDPNNLPELSLGLNFDDDRDDAVNVSINDWEFGVGDQTDPNDGALVAYNYFKNGLNGGEGVFEGLPFRVDIEYNGKTFTAFDGFLDVSSALIDCEKMTIPAVSLQGKDSFSNQADGFTYEYLFEEVKSFNSDSFIPVPYVISTIPNYLETVIALFTTASVAIQLREQVTNLSESLPDAVNPFTAFSRVATIAIRIAFITLLVITLVKLIIDIFNLIIQKVKYHMTMNVLELCQIGAAYLGYQFKSTILEKAPFKDLVILPEKFNQAVDSSNGVLGFFTADKTQQTGYYRGTFGQLLRDLKILFNGKVFVKDGIINLERRDFTAATPQFTIPNVEKPQFRLNSEEFDSNISISFTTDINDKNTIQQYQGTIIQIQSLPIVVKNQRNVLMNGFRQIVVPYALGKVKTELTFPEKVFDAFFTAIGAVMNVLVKIVNAIIKAVNVIIKVLNGIIKALRVIGIKIKSDIRPVRPLKTNNFKNLIDNRIGMLIMENDFVAVPKMLLIERQADDRANKPLPNNASVLNADYLWENFYSIESFVPSTGRPNANQYRITSLDQGVDLPCEDFEKLKNSEKVFDTNGIDRGEIVNLEWNPIDQVATLMEYKINKLYTSNLQFKKLESDGK